MDGLIKALNIEEGTCMYSFTKMMRAYSEFGKYFVRSNTEVNFQRLGMLFLIRDSGEGISQVQIAEELRIKPSSVTSMLNNMERDGYIVRKSDEKDKRVKHIYLTEKGISSSDAVLDRMFTTTNVFFENFNTDEKKQFIQLMSKLENNIKNIVMANKEE